jgi:hypothetical protein
MNFKEGDMIKYYFPDPLISGKDYITGKIFFIEYGKVWVRCDDSSTMNISFKNYERIELLVTENV